MGSQPKKKLKIIDSSSQQDQSQEQEQIKVTEKQPPFTISNYCATKIIGKGQFGIVYLCHMLKEEDKFEPHDRNQLALKKILIPSIKQDIKLFQQELDAYRTLKSDSIVEAKEIIRSDTSVYIVMEYSNGGGITPYRSKIFKHDQSLVKKVGEQMIKALHCTHSENFIHRDIKPDNIFFHISGDVSETIHSRGLVKSGQLSLLIEYFHQQWSKQEYHTCKSIMKNASFKLGDFGFTKKVKKLKKLGLFGTPSYMAPQVLNQKEYFKNADVYSLGVVLYELFFSRNLFLGNQVRELKKNQKKGEFYIPKRLQISKEFLDFLCLCLQKQQHYRPLSEQLISHTWITSDYQNLCFLKIKKKITLNIKDSIFVTHFNIHKQLWLSNELEYVQSSQIKEYYTGKKRYPLKFLRIFFNAYCKFSSKILQVLSRQLLRQILIAHRNYKLAFGNIYMDNIAVHMSGEIELKKKQYKRHLKQQVTESQIADKEKIEKQVYKLFKSANFVIQQNAFLKFEKLSQYKNYLEKNTQQLGFQLDYLSLKQIQEQNSDEEDKQQKKQDERILFEMEKDIYDLGILLYFLIYGQKQKKMLRYSNFISKNLKAKTKLQQKQNTCSQFSQVQQHQETKQVSPLHLELRSSKILIQSNKMKIKLRKGYSIRNQEISFIAYCMRIYTEKRRRITSQKKKSFSLKKYEEHLEQHQFIKNQVSKNLYTFQRDIEINILKNSKWKKIEKMIDGLLPRFH